MEGKSPRWSTAGPARNAAACPFCRYSSALFSSAALGSRARIRRYSRPICSASPVAVAAVFAAASARFWMNALFIRKICCSVVVVTSRPGADCVASGKSNNPSICGAARAADAPVNRAPVERLVVQVAREAAHRCDRAGRPTASACRDTPRRRAAAGSDATAERWLRRPAARRREAGSTADTPRTS